MPRIKPSFHLNNEEYTQFNPSVFFKNMYSWKSGMLLSFTSLLYPYWQLRSPHKVYLGRHCSQGLCFQSLSSFPPPLLLYCLLQYSPSVTSGKLFVVWHRKLVQVSSEQKKIAWRKTNILFLTWIHSLTELIPHHNRCINTPEEDVEQVRLQLFLKEMNVSITVAGRVLKY